MANLDIMIDHEPKPFLVYINFCVCSNFPPNSFEKGKKLNLSVIGFPQPPHFGRTVSERMGSIKIRPVMSNRLYNNVYNVIMLCQPSHMCNNGHSIMFNVINSYVIYICL